MPELRAMLPGVRGESNSCNLSIRGGEHIITSLPPTSLVTVLPRLLFILSILVSNESLRLGDKRENRFEG